MRPCPNERILDQYIHEQLDPESSASIEGHIETCQNCQALLSGLVRVPIPGIRRNHLRAIIAGVETKAPIIPGIELVGLIGHGAIGDVWKARQSDLGRLVAVKTLRTDIDDLELKNLRTEAEVLARLDHPNVVRVFQSGRTSDGYYFAMEYLPNGSLVEDRNRLPTLWEPKDIALLIRDSALAIQAAHDNQVLHRDLKPGNILLTDDRKAKVADFGQAATFGKSKSTETVGTPCYMSPEQAAGSVVDERADIYGLGAVFYDMLVGRPPVSNEGEIEDVMRRVIFSDVVPPRQLRPTIPLDLDTICMKCLEKRPTARYNSARELADDLNRFLDGRPVLARPLGPMAQLIRLAKRRPALSSLIISFLALLIFSTIAMALLYNRASANAELAKQRLQTAREALRTVARTREQQFWFPQNIQLQDPEPIEKLFELHADSIADYRNDPDAWHDTAYAMMQLSEMLCRYPITESVMDRLERAREAVRQLTEAYPNVPLYQLSHAEAMMQLSGQMSGPDSRNRRRNLRLEALAITERLTTESPKNNHYKHVHAAFLDSVGSIALEDDDFRSADRYLSQSVILNREAAKRFPKDAMRQFHLALALRRYSLLLLRHFHDPENFISLQGEIVEVFAATLKLEPSRTGLYQEYIEAIFRLACAYHWIGDELKCDETFSRGIEVARTIQRDHPEFDQFVGFELLFLHQNCFRQGRTNDTEMKTRYEAFRDRLAAMTLRFPKSDYFRSWNGYRLLMNSPDRNTTQAVEIFRKLAESKSVSVGARIGLIQALCENGEHEVSLRKGNEYLTNALPLDSSISLVLLLKAKNLWHLGRRDEARNELRSASDLVRKDYSADFTTGRYHDELWKLMEGTKPPSRTKMLDEKKGIPLLFR
jgi:serine/threonine protein kinase